VFRVVGGRDVCGVLILAFMLCTCSEAIAQVVPPSGPVSTERLGLMFTQEGKLLPLRKLSNGEYLLSLRRQRFGVLLNANTAI